MSAGLDMHTGTGSFRFPDMAAGQRGHIVVHYHVPKHVSPASHVMIALHGLDRAAAPFRDAFIASSERLGRIVVVPEFDAEAFPGVFAFNYGNVIRPDPGGRPNDRTAWNFDLIDRLFDHLLRSNAAPSGRFDLYGNSAGSQFVLRAVALGARPCLNAAIVSNSGVYMLPDLSVPYPSGMGGIGLGENDLRRYLSSPVRILLGDADMDAAAFDLPRTPEAVAQGPHRLARGLWHFEHCKALAQATGIDFGWTLEIVPGAGHISQAIFDRAMEISG